MWAIHVRFLRGVCVATDTGQWDETEWPPHPARLFMALAAAYFETQSSDSLAHVADPRRAALEWLEQQDSPRVLASEAVVRTPVTVYVPVNDSTKTDQLLPAARSRQPRHFPARIPDRDLVHYVFDGEIDAATAEGLEHVATEVVRVGHSSSLTQVWVEPKFEFPAALVEDEYLIEYTPADDSAGAQRWRVISPGMLTSLEASYNAAAIDEYAALEAAIGESKGKEKAELKSQMAERFPGGMPSSQRPQATLTIGYVRRPNPMHAPAASIFDPNMLVLAMHDAPQIGLESTLQLAGAVRKKIHDAFPDRTSPEWLGGHRADGTPATAAHMAIVPLPFVGHPHADGHLLGIGLVFPLAVPERERAIALRKLFERSEDGEWMLHLRLNEFRRLTGREPNCDISLVREQRLTPPQTLNIRTWTAASSVWETVTPIALDRFPKVDREKDRSAWHEEVAEIIAGSCENIGLPRPGAIHVHHNAFVSGVSKARPTGGGFPTMRPREGKPARFQVHARIEFDVPVVGPVILGAGRFVGYGFCRPNVARCRQRRGVSR